MRLTEKKLKQIIKEELERINEQEEQPDSTDDETKTLNTFRQFLFGLSKNVSNLKGASANEIKTAAELILDILESMPKGEISTYLAQTSDFLGKKLGGK